MSHLEERLLDLLEQQSFESGQEALVCTLFDQLLTHDTVDWRAAFAELIQSLLDLHLTHMDGCMCGIGDVNEPRTKDQEDFIWNIKDMIVRCHG